MSLIIAALGSNDACVFVWLCVRCKCLWQRDHKTGGEGEREQGRGRRRQVREGGRDGGREGEREIDCLPNIPSTLVNLSPADNNLAIIWEPRKVLGEICNGAPLYWP